MIFVMNMRFLGKRRFSIASILLGNGELSHAAEQYVEVPQGNEARCSGFSLVELAVILAVLSIFISIAVPAFQNTLMAARISSQTNSFVASLFLARSEALKRGAATLCPSQNGQSCSGGKSWENGWIVFADANANGVVNSGDTILHVMPALSGGNTLKSGARIRVTYHRDGYPQGFNDSFRVCDTRGTVAARTVILSNVGRVRIVTGASKCP